MGGAVTGASVVGAVLGTNAVIVGSVVVLDVVDVSSDPGPIGSGLSMLRSVPHAASTTTASSAATNRTTLRC